MGGGGPNDPSLPPLGLICYSKELVRPRVKRLFVCESDVFVVQHVNQPHLKHVHFISCDVELF